MKNFINYYYNFDIKDMSLHNEKYTFNNGSIKYMFKICSNMPIMDSYPNIEYQLVHYPFFSIAIPNKDGNYITWIDNKPYVLLKLNNMTNEKISIHDIKSNTYIVVNDKLSLLNRFPWTPLWENKIDYYENWFYEKQDSYKRLYCLFNYFIGIAENALLYLKETEKEATKTELDRLVISHDRVTMDYELYDYYDSTNIIIDHPSRDISEYIKSMFINREYDLDIIKDYLHKHSFSNYGLRIMLARICFPSFFFDYIEKMIVNNSDIDLLYLENRGDEFLSFIGDISIFFKNEYGIPIIPWIIKGI